LAAGGTTIEMSAELSLRMKAAVLNWVREQVRKRQTWSARYTNWGTENVYLANATGDVVMILRPGETVQLRPGSASPMLVTGGGDCMVEMILNA
jgi:hypothetical protein